jgi:hypothetical protein
MRKATAWTCALVGYDSQSITVSQRPDLRILQVHVNIQRSNAPGTSTSTSRRIISNPPSEALAQPVPSYPPAQERQAGSSAAPRSDRTGIVQRSIKREGYASAQSNSYPPFSYQDISNRDVLRWQRQVFALAEKCQCEGLAISGPNAESIATTLLDLLRFNSPVNEGVASFQPLPGVLTRMHAMAAFVQQFPEIEMYVIVTPSPRMRSSFKTQRCHISGLGCG